MSSALWIASSALGVWQTYLTAKVGNNVMGALRIRLFSHLQAMELGFFTRTKTGIIQLFTAGGLGFWTGVGVVPNWCQTGVRLESL